MCPDFQSKDRGFKSRACNNWLFLLENNYKFTSSKLLRKKCPRKKNSRAWTKYDWTCVWLPLVGYPCRSAYWVEIPRHVSSVSRYSNKWRWVCTCNVWNVNCIRSIDYISTMLKVSIWQNIMLTCVWLPLVGYPCCPAYWIEIRSFPRKRFKNCKPILSKNERTRARWNLFHQNVEPYRLHAMLRDNFLWKKDCKVVNCCR